MFRSLCLCALFLAGFGCGPSTRLDEVSWKMTVELDEDFESPPDVFQPTEARVLLEGLPASPPCAQLSGGARGKVAGEPMRTLVSGGVLRNELGEELPACQMPKFDHVFFRRAPPSGTVTYSLKEGSHGLFLEVANAYSVRALAVLQPAADSLKVGQDALLGLSVETDRFDPTASRVRFVREDGTVSFDKDAVPEDRALRVQVPVDAAPGKGSLTFEGRLLPQVTVCNGPASCQARVLARLTVPATLLP